jgi:hypothetical protein
MRRMTALIDREIAHIGGYRAARASALRHDP